MSDETLRLGLVQHAGSPAGIEGNLSVIDRNCEEAKADGIDFLVFPECFLTGYFREDGIADLAEQIDDAVIARLEQTAARTGVAFVTGGYERRDGGVSNTAYCVTPEAGCIARHRKRALYGPWEQRSFVPGDGPILVDYRGFRIGLQIFYDIEFPELTRELARNGADLVLVPTALMQPYTYIADYLVPARAIENQIFVAYANRIGSEDAFHYVGRSRICGPSGVLCAAGPDDETTIRADIRKTDISSSRAASCYIDEIPSPF